LFREYQEAKDLQKKYLEFLRDLLKDTEYTVLAYMTGILPIKKYGKHSALNIFSEFSMMKISVEFTSSVQFSRSVMSDSLQPHESQHARPPCPSPAPGVHSDSRPLSQ